MSGNAVSPAMTGLESLTDEEVVRRVRAGDAPLFEILMRRYNQRLYRVARSVVKDEAEAEDVMQQAYVNAYAHLDQFAERASFATWLTRIALHEALARARRRGRFAEIEGMQESRGAPALRFRGPDPEKQAFTGELRRALEVSLDALPEMYRLVFVLRDVEGLSTAETAQGLGISEDAVKARLHRAHGLLREELFERAGVAAADAFAFLVPRCDRVVASVFLRLGLEDVKAVRG